MNINNNSNNAKKISLVVLNYNDSETTIAFISRIREYKIIDHIVIVDNCSTDDSFAQLITLTTDKIDVIQSGRNGGYGYGNNYGVRYLINEYNSKYIAVSNPDVEISEATIEKCLIELIRNVDCAVVSPMMKMPNGEKNYRCVWKIPSFFQYSTFSLALLGKLGSRMYYKKKLLDSSGVIEVGCLAGSFLVFDSDKFARSGFYDENIFLYCEETVLGIRTQKLGYKSLLLKDDYFVHHHSVSINKSINSKYEQKKMMWSSREYVLKEYYPHSAFWGKWVGICKVIALLEAKIIR